MQPRRAPVLDCRWLLAALVKGLLASPAPQVGAQSAAGGPASKAARSAHALRTLPGLSPGAPSVAHYSGYMQVDGGLEIFYYLAPHPDPSKPLLVWMNGGPGASSLAGLFTELGPFLLNGRSVPDQLRGEGWKVFANPEGWHREASLLAWEQPAGVGFSHCRAGPCAPWNDTTAADANLRFLAAFFRAFPEERARQLFIAGESYGGIYVPLLAMRVLEHNKGVPEDAQIQLQGVALGNGCIGYAVDGACGTDSLELFVEVFERASPGVSERSLADVRASCAGELTVGLRPEELSAKCRPAMQRLFEEAGEYNFYHLGSPCGPGGTGNWGDGAGYSCGAWEALDAYLADAEVQCALHAIPCDNKTKPRRWQQWDGDSPFYNITEADAQPAYRALLAAGVRILVYNGLRDTAVPAMGAEKWVPRVAGAAIAEPRRHWGAPGGSLAGSVTVYESGLTFATLEGAGHLVPADRPSEARAMLAAWLRGERLPPYTGARCQRIWLGRGFGGGDALCGRGWPRAAQEEVFAV